MSVCHTSPNKMHRAIRDKELLWHKVQQNFLNTNDTFVEETADSRIEELHEKIRLLKASRRWEAQYMTFEELLRDTREEGIEKGQDRMLTLISRMSESGEAHLIPGLSEDPALLQEMLEKYGL